MCLHPGSKISTELLLYDCSMDNTTSKTVFSSCQSLRTWNLYLEGRSAISFYNECCWQVPKPDNKWRITKKTLRQTILKDQRPVISGQVLQMVNVKVSASSENASAEDY